MTGNETARPRVNEVKIQGKRHYELPNGQVVPSVTTILSVLPKPALDKWKLNRVATWAVENVDAWRGLPQEAAVKVLADSVWYDNSSSMHGDIVHRIMEEKAIGRPEEEIEVPLGYEGAALAWDMFTSDFEVEVLYAEPQLVNYTVGYSGSADLLAMVNGKCCIIDHKSGNGLYGSTAYQGTAYGKAETIILPGTEGKEIDMPKVEALYGLWVRPNGYALYPLAYNEDTWKIVRAAKLIFDLTKSEWSYRGKPINPNPIKSAGKAWGLPSE